jgi:hypothetical protein
MLCTLERFEYDVNSNSNNAGRGELIAQETNGRTAGNSASNCTPQKWKGCREKVKEDRSSQRKEERKKKRKHKHVQMDKHRQGHKRAASLSASATITIFPFHSRIHASQGHHCAFQVFDKGMARRAHSGPCADPVELGAVPSDYGWSSLVSAAY